MLFGYPKSLYNPQTVDQNGMRDWYEQQVIIIYSRSRLERLKTEVSLEKSGVVGDISRSKLVNLLRLTILPFLFLVSKLTCDVLAYFKIRGK